MYATRGILAGFESRVNDSVEPVRNEHDDTTIAKYDVRGADTRGLCVGDVQLGATLALRAAQTNCTHDADNRGPVLFVPKPNLTRRPIKADGSTPNAFGT